MVSLYTGVQGSSVLLNTDPPHTMGTTWAIDAVWMVGILESLFQPKKEARVNNRVFFLIVQDFSFKKWGKFIFFSLRHLKYNSSWKEEEEGTHCWNLFHVSPDKKERNRD